MHYIPTGDERIVITSDDIGRVTADDILRAWMSKVEALDISDVSADSPILNSTAMLIDFQDSPIVGLYTRQQLQQLLNQMQQSCDEVDVLTRLQMITGHSDVGPLTWKNLVLYRGDQEYLYDDISLNEAGVCLLARNLHGDEFGDEQGERHCVTAVCVDKLPEHLTAHCHKLTPGQVRQQAALVISSNHVIEVVERTENGGGPFLFGQVVFTRFKRGFVANLTNRFKTYRIRPGT